MAYHTYTTDAFVLGSAWVGEGSKTLALYTKELGLVYALARSVRELRSKLRFGLQTGSLSQVSLVKGREVWRIIGARPGDNFFGVFGDDAARQKVVAQVFALLRRLVRGEEPHRELFDVLERGFEHMGREHGLKTDELALLEALIVLRMLNVLGYVPKLHNPLMLGADPYTPLSCELLRTLRPHEKEVFAMVNQGLSVSGL